jgi:hypothetical protein
VSDRARLSDHFGVVLAVHTSLVEPLPHQITAVYGAMLPRQPLRFLLADNPGTGLPFEILARNSSGSTATRPDVGPSVLSGR